MKDIPFPNLDSMMKVVAADMSVTTVALDNAGNPLIPVMYPVIGKPLLLGTLKNIFRLFAPETTFVMTGASGTPTVIGNEFETAENPPSFVPTIAILYDVLLSNPGIVNGLDTPETSTIAVPFNEYLNCVMGEPFEITSLKCTYAHPFPGVIRVIVGGSGRWKGINVFGIREYADAPARFTAFKRIV